MSTIPDYPAPARALTGEEALAAWQDGHQIALPVATIVAEAVDAIAPELGRAEAAAEAAEGYARSAGAAGITLLTNVTAQGNALNTDMPSGGFVDGQLYRFISPITNTGALTLNALNVLEPGGAPIFASSAIASGGDVIVRFQFAGFNFHLVHATPAVDLRVMNELVTVTSTDANNIEGTTPSGRQIPVTGTLRSFISGAAPNTGGVTLVVNGYGYVIRKDGDAPVGAGDLPANSLIVVSYQGDHYRLVSNGSPKVPDILSAWMADFISNPWGVLSYDDDGAVQMVPLHHTISGAGSSVGQDEPEKNGGAPAGYAPNRLLCNKFNAAWPLGGVVLDNDNQSIGGQALAQFAAQLGNSTADAIAARKAITCVPGMNDFQIGGYNTNQTFPAARDALVSIIGQCIGAGIPLILFTSPHPNTPAFDYNFFGAVPSIPQYYPLYHAAPVDNDDQVYPPVASSRITRDWTGSGVEVEGDVRFWHGNNMLRAIARQYRDHVFLLDAEYAWFRYGVEPRGSCADLYDPGSTVHPNTLGHEVSFGRVITEFVGWLVGQRFDDRRSFRG